MWAASCWVHTPMDQECLLEEEGRTGERWAKQDNDRVEREEGRPGGFGSACQILTTFPGLICLWGSALIQCQLSNWCRSKFTHQACMDLFQGMGTNVPLPQGGLWRRNSPAECSRDCSGATFSTQGVRVDWACRQPILCKATILPFTLTTRCNREIHLGLEDWHERRHSTASKGTMIMSMKDTASIIRGHKLWQRLRAQS